LINDARSHGATDVEVHDTVLIAAAFCMINRHVDGFGTLAPNEPRRYQASVAAIVAHGYSTSSQGH
jgi:hypothetical protein